MISRKDDTIQFSEFSGQFTNHVNNADKHRGESLQRLHRIRSSRQKNQISQLKRLTIKHGKDHPRVIRQAERIANEKEMENYLSVAISKTEVETEIIKDSFIMKGRVFADNIKGLAGLKVQLQDTRNNVVGKPVSTDSRGFFSLVVDVDKSVKVSKVILVVLDKEGTQIHKEKLPVLIKSDAIESRDIVLKKVNRVPRDKNTLIKDALISKPKKSAVVKKSKVVKRAPLKNPKGTDKRAIKRKINKNGSDKE